MSANFQKKYFCIFFVNEVEYVWKWNWSKGRNSPPIISDGLSTKDLMWYITMDLIKHTCKWHSIRFDQLKKLGKQDLMRCITLDLIKRVWVTFDKIWSTQIWWTWETGEFKLIPAANPVKLIPMQDSTKMSKKENKDASFIILLLYFDTSKNKF